MVSVRPKDITKRKSRERKDLLPAASKGAGIFMKGLESRRIQHRTGTEVDRVQALEVVEVMKVSKGQLPSSQRFHLI